ncbi:MAG: methionine--tRNA ligase [Patescibacteria group bacterium]
MPKQKKTFYVTTTLPYVNADPHLGFAMEIIRADALARYHALQGEEVIFNTGTDEHGLKIYRKAQENGLEPQEYVDGYSAKFQGLKDALHLSYTHFTRTTDAHHVKAAQEFWKRCRDNGDIYKKQYQVKYCVGCELEKTDSELVDGKCPLHPTTALELIDEENYFFRFSKYQQALLDLYDAHPDFVQPDYRLKEIRNFVSAGLTDFSVSRLKTKMPWGVEVPDDADHVMYVWFDALVNYISVLGWPEDQKTFERFWPGVQVCGKDNLRPQTAMWQAMLCSAGLPNSARVYVGGFLTVNGQKISKSLGNVIDPIALCNEYQTDPVRYFLLREIPFGDDGDFSYERLLGRYTSDLGNGLGNLLNRVIAMSRKYCDGKVPTVDPAACKIAVAGTTWEGEGGLQKLAELVGASYAEVQCDAALDALWLGRDGAKSSIAQANQYIQETEPFKLVKTDPEAVSRILYSMLEACRWYAWLLTPAMPQVADEILAQLGLNVIEERTKTWNEALTWGGLVPGSLLPEPKVLFPRKG